MEVLDTVLALIIHLDSQSVSDERVSGLEHQLIEFLC